MSLADFRAVKLKFAAAALAPFGHPGSEALEAATGRAIRWIKEREKVEGRQAGVVLPQRRHYDALGGFDKGRPSGTPRSHAKLTAGPVLVYAANMDMLDLGGHVANGSSIVVVDWALKWLPGWAAVVTAVNLQSGEATAAFQAETTELLDQLDWAGNNGWFDKPGKRDAKRLLAEIDLPTAHVQGAMLAYGHSVKSVEALAKIGGPSRE